MDKNTISGLVLIFAILITFSYLNKPSQEEIAAEKRRKDSIEQVAVATQRQAEKEALQAVQQAATTPAETPEDSVAVESADALLKDKFGAFAPFAKGEEQFITLENNLMKVTLSNLGGRIYSVELKGYTTHDGEPLILFEGDANRFGLNFFAQNRSIQTENFYFVSSAEGVVSVEGPEVPKGKEGREKFNTENKGDSKKVSMRMEVASGQALEYEYVMHHNSYMIDFNLKTEGMPQIMGQNATYLDFAWAIEVPRQEKISKYGEDRYTTIYYKYYEDEVDKLSPSKAESESLSTKVKWIGYKQLFFSSVLIADNAFPNADIRNEPRESDPDFLANFYSTITIPLEGRGNENFPMHFYFGPNQYNTLKQYQLGLDEELDLGWAIIGWVNKWIVIPAFDFLRRYINNFGIIILLLTIYIKLIISPFTFKSYISQAKMRALKPEIDEIQKKFGKEKQMESQQATMALYKKAGVNPMGGCLPMVFQFPILIAMFRFFPVSIELRQQSFLWAKDLSAYDSILSLPFEIPFYGDHVSLFCLLMTITNIFYIKMNSEMNPAGSNQMPGMKTMMYMMPVMFLFMFNNYASGLSLYYFLSLLFTFIQMFIFKKSINEDQIRAKIKERQKRPVKKSNFQKRLEDMARQRGMEMPKK